MKREDDAMRAIERVLDASEIEPLDVEDEVCESCGSPVRVQCFRRTGICSTLCEEYVKGKRDPWADQAIAELSDPPVTVDP